MALLTGSTAISFGHGGGVGLSALLWQAFYIHQLIAFTCNKNIAQRKHCTLHRLHGAANRIPGDG